MKILLVLSVFGMFLAVSARTIDNFHVLGAVDGKTFVTSHSKAPRSWNESKAFCETNGWSLARITSNAQAELLKSVYDRVSFDGWYWVGAQYNEITEEFMWIGTRQKVKSLNSLRFSSWSNEDENKNCLTYSSNNHAAGYYFRRACNHGHLALCESSQPIESTPMIPQSGGELKEIGNFRGKSYFSDHVIRNWTDSDAICRSKGLQLATVTSNIGLLEFLRESCTQIILDGWFWIAKSNADTFIPTFGRSRLGNRNCPCFHPRDGRNFRRECLHRHFTLCESVNPAGPETIQSEEDYTEEKSAESPEVLPNMNILKTLKLLSDNYEKMSPKQQQEVREVLVMLAMTRRANDLNDGHGMFLHPDIYKSEEDVSSSEEFFG